MWIELGFVFVCIIVIIINKNVMVNSIKFKFIFFGIFKLFFLVWDNFIYIKVEIGLRII